MPVLMKLPGEKAPAAPAAGGIEEEEGGVGRVDESSSWEGVIEAMVI